MGNVARVYQLQKYVLKNALTDSLNFCVFPGPTFDKLERRLENWKAVAYNCNRLSSGKAIS